MALGDPVFSLPAQPSDIVTVPEAPRVNVVGTVAKPGVVALKTDSTLLSALYTAGGPTRFANLKDVQVMRGTTNGLRRHPAHARQPHAEPGIVGRRHLVVRKVTTSISRRSSTC